MNTISIVNKTEVLTQFKIYLLLLMMTMIVVNCSNDDDEDALQAPESAVNKALALIPGTVTESEPEIEEGVSAWKVDITTQQGAEVEVYCRQDNNDLLRIDGESGPFDYNIAPGNGLIDFNQAKTIADGETDEDLGSWQLRMEDKYNNQWVYTLEHTTTRVYINAVDGTVLDVES
jgi:uncharacterized membrane protein YkoI